MTEVNNNQCPRCLFSSPCIIVLKDHIQCSHGPVKFVQLDSLGEKEVEMVCSCEDCKCESELKANIAKLLENQQPQNQLEQFEVFPVDVKDEGLENCVIELINGEVQPSLEEEVIKIEVVDSLSEMGEGSVQISEDPSIPPEETYECDYCFFTTGSRQQLMEHMDKDICFITSFTCDDCTFQTNNESDLNAHIKKNHSQIERLSYKCGMCSFTTLNKGIFSHHVSRKHAGSEGLNCYVCHYCQYRAVDATELFMHMGKKHQTKYKCSVCSYKAYKKSDLDTHIAKSHRTYVCSHCDFTTKFVPALKSHMSKHA